MDTFAGRPFARRFRRAPGDAPLDALGLLLLPLVLPLALLGLTPAMALAANRLGNGDFDVDVSGWRTSEPVGFVWDAFDVDSDPGSGSLELTTMPAGMTTGFHGAESECVPFVPGEEPEVEAWVYIPSNQIGPVQAAIALRQYASPNCQALDLLTQQNGPITTVLDQWTELSFTGLIVPGAAAARVSIQARESAGGMQDPTTTYWDAVFLPEPARASPFAAAAALLVGLGRRRGRVATSSPASDQARSRWRSTCCS